jgi:hypothetical protein
MPEKGKSQQPSSQAATPIVLFGVDEKGKPKAARFADKHADLAIKAAGQLQLQVLAVTDPAIADIAAKLPAGRIHANGRGLVPFIRKDLYEKLRAAAGPAAGPPSPATQTAGAASSGTPDKPVGHPGAQLPRTWDEIGPGSVVIAQDGPRDGWYDASVAERNGDMLTLRWCDYPRERRFVRHWATVALLYPNVHGAATDQPAKPGPGKAAARKPASADQPYPQTWEDIAGGCLVLAREDGPWRSLWEAIPTEVSGDSVTLRWRDFPKLPNVVRNRYALALLRPAAQ